MIVDVVLAETVISRALGTESEFEIGTVGIGPAAYGALMGIETALLLLADPLGLAFEADGIRRSVFTSAEKAFYSFKHLTPQASSEAIYQLPRSFPRSQTAFLKT